MQGTIVDATLIHSTGSTKNPQDESDLDIHQTKKGKQWCYSKKVHIGVDADSGLVHHVIVPVPNVADVTMVDQLQHSKEIDAFGDAGFTGVCQRVEQRSWKVRRCLALKSGQCKALTDFADEQRTCLVDTVNAKIRVKAEYPFRVNKQQSDYMKTHYQGLKRSAAQLMTLFGLANIWLTRGTLLMGG